MTSTRWKRYKWVRTGVYQLRGWVRDDSMMLRVLNTITNVAHDSQKTTFFLNDREVDGRTAMVLDHLGIDTGNRDVFRFVFVPIHLS